MKKIKLVTVYTEYSYDRYGDEELNKIINDSSDWFEVSDEDYKLLCHPEVRRKLMNQTSVSSDYLVLIEDKTRSLNDIIKDLKPTLEKINQEAKERERKNKLAAEKRKATLEKRKAEAEKKKIEKARKLLEEAGEL
jgi:hypothetical protein